MDYVLDYVENFKKRGDCISNHIALLIKGNIIVGHGYNKFNLTCKTLLSDPVTIHAEMDCISNYLNYQFNNRNILNFRRQKFSMFVTKKSKTGILGMSTPCVNCLEKMYYFGIHRIYWTDECGTIHFEKVSVMLHPDYPKVISAGNRPRKLRDTHFSKKKT